MERTIVQNGDPILRQIAQDVPPCEITSPHIREIIADMKRLLAAEEYGVAIAAPQVGEALRIFVVSCLALKKRGESEEGVATSADETYINPVLMKVSRGKKDKHEGCLSMRGKWGSVPRAEKATVRAFDEEGRPFTRGASGFLAHIFQHELDHLDGILYVDRATEVHDDAAEDHE